jgi:hypothetical protein
MKMVKELAEGITKWFKTKMGLSTKRLDIQKELNDFCASLEDCEVLWGKRKSNNDFKFLLCNNSNLVFRIHELWPLIYQKPKIINNTITIC